MFSNELVCNILDYIDKNIDVEIKIDTLANIFYFNRTYIMKKFKKELGISIINYINIKKIYISLKYFKDDKTILEIALKSGFNSQEYYTEMFRSILNVSPFTYKKYIKYIVKLESSEVETIQKKLIEIETLLNFINKYQINRKPKDIVKTLSLFNK